MSIIFCPVCQNALKRTITSTPEGATAVQNNCLHCGFNEEFRPKTSEEALVLETTFAEKGAGAKQVSAVLNEYTLLDPTMPHLTTIGCPNTECPTRADPTKRDVLYMKTDAQKLKYQYCCMVCKTQWSS